MMSGIAILLVCIGVFSLLLRIKNFYLNEVLCVAAVIIILYPTVKFLDEKFPSAALELSIICVLAPSVEEFIRYVFRRKQANGVLTVRSISVVIGAFEALVKIVYTNIYFSYIHSLQDKIIIHSSATTINTMFFHINIGLFWEQLNYNKSSLHATFYCILLHSVANFTLIGAEPPSLYGKLYFVFAVLLLNLMVFMPLMYLNKDNLIKSQ